VKGKPWVVALALLLVATLLIPSTAIAQSLAPPTQEFPANGATDVPIDTWASWSDPNFSQSPTFRVQVSRTSNFTDLLVNANLDGSTGYALRGLPKNTVFYWRVRISVGGQTSVWSPVWTFRITNREIPAPPTLVSPEDGATGVPRSPTLVWNAAEGADSYSVKIVGCGLEFTVEGTSITIPAEGFDLSGCYADGLGWYVRSRNPAGLSEPSETWTFIRVPQ
jgi:trimeric autotransporter adhesin